MSASISGRLSELNPIPDHQTPRMVEKSVAYTGERRSSLSFFYQFPRIILRWHGSVLPYILIELSFAIGLGFVATYVAADEDIDPAGHGLVGTLLAFLVVFRSQMAWGQYTEGRAHIGNLASCSRALAVDALGPLGLAAAEAGEAELPREAHELSRLLKLFYYTCIEHLRSSSGEVAWDYVQRVALSYSTPREAEWLRSEFGPAQPMGQRQKVMTKAASSKPGRRVSLPTDYGAELSTAFGLAANRGEGEALLRLENRARSALTGRLGSATVARKPCRVSVGSQAHVPRRPCVHAAPGTERPHAPQAGDTTTASCSTTSRAAS